MFPEAHQKRDGFQGNYLLCILEERRNHCGELHGPHAGDKDKKTELQKMAWEALTWLNGNKKLYPQRVMQTVCSRYP